MPALVAGIHGLLCFHTQKDVDGRNKSGHDSVDRFRFTPWRGPVAARTPANARRRPHARDATWTRGVGAPRRGGSPAPAGPAWAPRGGGGRGGGRGGGARAAGP